MAQAQWFSASDLAAAPPPVKPAGAWLSAADLAGPPEPLEKTLAAQRPTIPEVNLAPPKPPAPQTFERPYVSPSLTPAADLGLTAPIEGAKQAISGAATLGHRIVAPLTVQPTTGLAMQRGEAPPETPLLHFDDETKNAAADVLVGLMTAGVPAATGALVQAPVQTLIAMGATWLAGATADQIAQAVKASPTDRRFYTTLAQAVTAAGGAKLLVDHVSAAAATVAEGAKAAARPLVLAGKLSGSGFGPGDVPGARGVPYADVETAQATPIETAGERAVAEDIRTSTQRAAETRAAGQTTQDEILATLPDISDAAVQELARNPTSEKVRAAATAEQFRRQRDKERGALPRESVQDWKTAQDLAPAGPTTAPGPLSVTTVLPPEPSAEHIGVTGQASDWHDASEVVSAEPLPSTVVEPNVARETPEALPTGKEGGPSGTLEMVVGDRRYQVASFQDASEKFSTVRDAFEQQAGPGEAGASRTPQPIIEQDGQPVAHVSYNGRVWPGLPHEWASGLTPLYDPRAPIMGELIHASETPTPPTGTQPPSAGPERGPVAEGGMVTSGREAGSLPRGGGRAPDLSLAFQRQAPADTAARLTPDVRDELGRILEEMQTFPFVSKTFNEAPDAKGNAGHYDIVGGSAGTPVYDDILGEAPLAKPKAGKKLARQVSATRGGDVQRAIRRVLDTNDIHSHLAEGAVRVAEKRARGDWSGLSAPWLPPLKPRATIHEPDLDAAIEQEIAEPSDSVEPEGAVDTSFRPEDFEAPKADVLATGEAQPRLPEAGAVREQEKPTPTFEAPFSLTAPKNTATQSSERDLLAGHLEPSHEMRALAISGAPVKAAVAGIRAAHADLRATLTAPTVSHPARLSSRYLRYRIAQMMHTVGYATKALEPYRNAVEGLTIDHATILDLADALETGGTLPAWLAPWGQIRTEVFDYLKKQIAGLGIEKEWREYYLGHVWETEFKEGQPLGQQMLARLIGRRPLQGPKSFLKKRTIPTMREGVERFGKEPKTWNLVELDLYKMQEMAKYVLGRQALEDNKRLGTWVFVSALKKAPEGMVQIPDPIGQIWAPPTITVGEAYDQLLMEGLENFVRGLGVKYERTAGSGATWGRTDAKTGAITVRVGSPESVVMHEVGHALDVLYGLYDRIATVLKTPEFPGERSALKELQALAALRYEGVANVPPEYKRYVHQHSELIANLVHAYLYAPERAKAVAPHAYDALDDLVLREPTLAPLGDLQQMRGLVLGQREVTQRLPGPILLGRYYAPPEVARIFKNYLTPGLNANRLWALLRIPANALVQAKLFFSAFHAFTITQEAAAMEAARGFTAVLRGHPVTGVKRIGRALAEPVAVIQRGRAIRKEYYGTLDPLSLAVDSATNLLLAGGGRVEQSAAYTNQRVRTFVDHLRRANAAFVRQQHGRVGSELLGAALRALPALVEAGAYPILGWLVPTVKAGAVTTQIRSDLEALPGRPTEATLLAVASKAVNLGDAVLGEVTWDNYFLPRALMSAVHMVIMAPGWRGGSAVLLARGLTDPLRRLAPSQRERYAVRVPAVGGGGPAPAGGPLPSTGAAAPPAETTKTVPEPYWSPYTSLMIATVFVQVLVSELYQMAHGAGHVKTPLDVAFPRTGKVKPDGSPERVRLPGYAGIFYDILRDVPSSILDYALGGTAPLPTGIGQLYRNETVFGDEIIDHTDPWRTQLADYAKFLKEQFTPISVSSYGRRAGTPAEKAESALGISPAPARATRSAAEAYLREIAPPIHRTKDEAVRAQARQDLRTAVRNKDKAGVKAAVQAGALSALEVRNAVKSTQVPTIARSFQSTTFPQALRAYELATPDERLVLRMALAQKARTHLAQVPMADRADMLARYKAALALPVGTRRVRTQTPAPQAAGATQ